MACPIEGLPGVSAVAGRKQIMLYTKVKAKLFFLFVQDSPFGGVHDLMASCVFTGMLSFEAKVTFAFRVEGDATGNLF
jgi:hypothetical protein